MGHLSAEEVMQAHETQVGLKDVDKDGDGNLSLEEVLNDLELQIGYDGYFELTKIFCGCVVCCQSTRVALFGNF